MSEPIEDMLIRHEGLRLSLYKCSAGKLTIGVGHNLEANGISKEIAMLILKEDIENCKKDLCKYDWFNDLDQVRQDAMIDMCFNLGLPTMLKFKNMIAALLRNDFNVAAEEMLNSNWHRQVGKRAEELAGMVRFGVAV